MSADHEVVHTPDSGLYKALYKHTATSKPNDIDLNIGDTCRIDSEDEEYVEIENKDWVYAHNLNTKMEGYVPRNYLVKISNSSARPARQKKINIKKKEMQLIRFHGFGNESTGS